MTDHGDPLRDGEWWACQYPERPIDSWAAFLRGCPKCLLHLRAERASHGEFSAVLIDVHQPWQLVTATEMLDQW
jgi:hypothetical protein